MSQMEHMLVSAMKPDIVAYLRAHPEAFAELLALGLTNRQALGWRAVWALEEVVEPNDSRVLPYLTQILDFLPQAEDGHCRQWLMVLHHMSLAENQLAPLFDLCMALWCNPHKQPSVRYHAFLTMERIAKIYPELQAEIEASLSEPLLESLSPGIRHSLIKRGRL